MHHILATLPDIKQRIISQRQKYNAELQSLGGGNSSSIVLSIMTEFTNEFRTVIDGNMNDLSLELSGGARISFIFHEQCWRKDYRSIWPSQGRRHPNYLMQVRVDFYVAIRY